MKTLSLTAKMLHFSLKLYSFPNGYNSVLGVVEDTLYMGDEVLALQKCTVWWRERFACRGVIESGGRCSVACGNS